MLQYNWKVTGHCLFTISTLDFWFQSVWLKTLKIVTCCTKYSEYYHQFQTEMMIWPSVINLQHFSCQRAMWPSELDLLTRCCLSSVTWPTSEIYTWWTFLTYLLLINVSNAGGRTFSIRISYTTHVIYRPSHYNPLTKYEHSTDVPYLDLTTVSIWLPLSHVPYDMPVGRSETTTFRIPHPDFPIHYRAPVSLHQQLKAAYI